MFKVKPISDFGWYFQRGQSIADGAGYSVNGVPTAYWPVGYPGFLAIIFSIFGDSLFLAKLANVILYLAIIILAYLFSKRMFQNEQAARITLFILAFYPNHIAYSSLLASETIFTFSLILGAVLFISTQERIGSLVITGLCWGLAALVKPQAILVPMIFLLVYYTNKKTLLKSGAVIYLMFLLTLAPWMGRNYLVLGKPILSTNGSINLLIGNSPYSDGSYIWNQELKSLLGDTKDEVDRDNTASKLAINYIINNPVKTIMLWPKKIFYLYAADFEGISYNQAGMAQSPVINGKYVFGALKAIAQVYYMLTTGLFFVAIPLIFREEKRRWIGLFLIIYFTLIALAFFGSPRFHFPLIPWIAIYSGIGGIAVLNRHSPKPKAVGGDRHSNVNNL